MERANYAIADLSFAVGLHSSQVRIDAVRRRTVRSEESVGGYLSNWMLQSVTMMSKIGRTFGCLTNSNPYFSKVRFFSNLFVSRLSFYTTNEDLKGMFSPFGEVKEARLVFDPRTLRPKGFGFVTFETDAEAQKAMKALNGTVVRGRLIFVEPVKAKDDAGDAGCDSGLQSASRSTKVE